MSDTNGESNGKTMTKFEARYAELKQAKEHVRSTQSAVSQLGEELVDLKRMTVEADRAHQRAKQKVDVLKDGLGTLFEEEMRNY